MNESIATELNELAALDGRLKCAELSAGDDLLIELRRLRG